MKVALNTKNHQYINQAMSMKYLLHYVKQPAISPSPQKELS
jgi:hypothetical protein